MIAPLGKFSLLSQYENCEKISPKQQVLIKLSPEQFSLFKDFLLPSVMLTTRIFISHHYLSQCLIPGQEERICKRESSCNKAYLMFESRLTQGMPHFDIYVLIKACSCVYRMFIHSL